MPNWTHERTPRSRREPMARTSHVYPETMASVVHSALAYTAASAAAPTAAPCFMANAITGGRPTSVASPSVYTSTLGSFAAKNVRDDPGRHAETAWSVG